MRIIVTKDYNDMSRKAANIILAQIITKPDYVLVLLPVLHRSVLIRHCRLVQKRGSGFF